MITAMKKMINDGFRTEHGHEIFDISTLPERHPDIMNEDGTVNWDRYGREIRDRYFARLHPMRNNISFDILDRPISEGGRGVQWYEVVEIMLGVLKGLNIRFPSRENSLTITKLEEALMWNRERTRNRVERGVEGQNKD